MSEHVVVQSDGMITDLTVVTQDELDALAYELNIQPRKRFDFKNPIEMMNELIKKYQSGPSSIQ